MTATPRNPSGVAETLLFHLLSESAPLSWGADIQPPSLATEGFVHLCTQTQLAPTAERWFAGEKTLLALALDADRLRDQLRWEDLYQHGELFPHLYGPIPGRAWLGVLRLQRTEQGGFAWPLNWNSPLSLPPVSEAALIEPQRRFRDHQRLPENCLLCYFPWAIRALAQSFSCRTEARPGSGVGPEQVTILDTKEGEFAICQPGLGGPAAAICLEELIALGCRRFVLCGGAGALTTGSSLGETFLVTRALRDEGVSHHYLATTQDLNLDPDLLALTRSYFSQRKVELRPATVWSTDALYRETPSRISHRRHQGADLVDMETSALLAVAQFRGVSLVPLLCCGDDLSGEEWDFRNWTSATDHHLKALKLSFDLLGHLASANG